MFIDSDVVEMLLDLQIHKIVNLPKFCNQTPIVKRLTRKIYGKRSKFKEIFKIFSNNSEARQPIKLLNVILNNIGLSAKQVNYEKRNSSFYYYSVTGEGLEELKKHIESGDSKKIKESFTNAYLKECEKQSQKESQKRDELKNNNKKICGVYRITCIPTNDFYIGQSKDIYSRFYDHKYNLRNSIHENKKMQYLWNKYPEEFSFDIEKITEEPLRLEKEIIAKYSSDYHLLNIVGKNLKKLSIPAELKAELTRICVDLEKNVDSFASELLDKALSDYRNSCTSDTKNDEQFTQPEDPIKKDESKLEILTPNSSTSRLVSTTSKPRSPTRKKRNCVIAKFYRAITIRYPNNDVPIGLLKNAHVFAEDVRPNEEDIGKVYKGKDGSQWKYLGWGKASLSGVKSKLFKLVKMPYSTKNK